jgi:uncharacterized metal-binding protein
MELYKEVLEDSANAYDKVMHFAAEASRQEISCYFPSYYNSNINMAIKPRIVETIELCQRMGYKKIGLAFCGGLQKEAFMLIKVLEAENLEIVSVMCKIGGKDKTCLGLAPDEKINKNSTHESMCNPIGQAAILNREKTEFNLVLGLCVGHDSLFLKHSDALCTVIAVKDRVTGHNPLVTLYTMDSYYRYMK